MRQLACNFQLDHDKVEKYLNKISIGLLFFITVIFFALATYRPEAMGESDDYMLATEALQNHFSLEITEQDVQQAKKDFPEHAWYFQSSWDAGMPALFSLDDENVYPWYMGTYSLLCIPMKICLEKLKLNQSYAFALTNAILAIIALWGCYSRLRISSANKLILIFMLGFSPIWGYIRWPSAEVMIFAFVILSLIFFSRKNYYLAGLFVSLAGTMNIAIMALGMFYIIDFIKNTYLQHCIEEKNVFKIILKERKKIILLVLCFIPSLITPVFNYMKFGLINLQSILGFATKDGYLNRAWAYLFDLNIGFLPYFAISFISFCVMIVIGLMRKQWSSLIYGGAFFGTVSLYSITYHINCGMTGLPRYSAWAFPILVFYLIVETNFSVSWKKNVYLVVFFFSTVFTFKVSTLFTDNLTQTPVAQFVLDNCPELYNPDPSIFISRVAKISGGYMPYHRNVPEAVAMGTNYDDYLPVVYCDKKGNVRKILVIPEIADGVISYFDGTNDEMNCIREQVIEKKNSGGAFYVNSKDEVKIKDEFYNDRFAYTYGTRLKPSSKIPLGLLRVNDSGEIKNCSIVLSPQGFQYGPYFPLDKGMYRVHISGTNLLSFSESVLLDNSITDIVEIEKTNEKIVYEFANYDDAASVEIRGLNEGNEIIEIYTYEIEEIK